MFKNSQKLKKCSQIIENKKKLQNTLKFSKFIKMSSDLYMFMKI